MTEPEPTQSTFGQRHPVLITILIVFGVGLLSGAFIDLADNIFLSAFIGGVVGASLFLLLTSVPALIITVVQSIRRTVALSRSGAAS